MAVEMIALVALVVNPSHVATSTGTAHLVADGQDLSSDAAPSTDRRPLPTTTVAVPAPTTTVPPPPTPRLAAVPATTVAPTPPPAPVRAAAVVPAHAILPPANPSVSIPPQPNFLSACSAAAYDNSTGCVSTTLAAIAHGRSAEGLPAMSLPTNWGALGPDQQLYVATNLERTVRGLAPLSAMATVLDQAASAGAASGIDPSPPGGFPSLQWGANWAGGVGSPLEAVYYWMYDDGPGSSNADCSPSNTAGCWGHRDKILMSLSCSPCVMGTGYGPTGWQGQPSWAEILVGTAVAPAVDFSWEQEEPYLS
jgi:hypothetical protein